MIDRRKFLKAGCAACLGIIAAPLFLESCASGLSLVEVASDDKILRVSISRFKLPTDILIIRNNTLDNDILLRKEGDQYLALDLSCTHEGVGLTPTKDKIYCNAHGSVFDLEGNVIREPALKPLKKYRTAFEENAILIYLT